MADIIVVEDNEEIGALLSDFLRAEGYDTYLALSGEEALEIYEAEGAKLVFGFSASRFGWIWRLQ